MVVSPYALFEKARRQFSEFKPTTDIFGPSSEIFVGKYGYPNVAAGPMVGITGEAISPRNLFGKDYSEILASQMSFVRGNKMFEINSRIQLDMQEVALSSKAIDVEMQLSKAPQFNPEVNAISSPIGASGLLKKFVQAENPKIPGKVDSISHEQITATTAISELMGHGFDSYYITNIFSVGTLGKEESKRLVPTRWSITAVDDIIAKQRMERIREYPEFGEVIVYSSTFLDNTFHILFMPGKWEFENFEAWPQGGAWAGISEEYEGYYGRTTYAEKQVGGYYASRFGVTEHLDNIRKQAKTVVFREIGEGYVAPVGVWQVRENVRNAFATGGAKFSTVNEAFTYLRGKLKYGLNRYVKMSTVLSQRRLTEF